MEHCGHSITCPPKLLHKKISSFQNKLKLGNSSKQYKETIFQVGKYRLSVIKNDTCRESQIVKVLVRVIEFVYTFSTELFLMIQLRATTLHD